MNTKKVFEIGPGIDALRYFFTFGGLELLSRRAETRSERFFVSIAGSIDRHVLSEGLFEKGVLKIIEQVCRSTGHTKLMIDVGANIGNHTVALAKTFEKVESVEPHPVLFRILEANILHNGLANVNCHNIGIANCDSSGTLVESPIEHGLSRVRERSMLDPEVFGLSSQSFGREFNVQLKDARLFALDFADDLDRTFMKIDVEGMEHEILATILPLLKQYKPIIGFEWFTKSQPQIADLIRAAEGFELWGIRLHDVGKSRLKRAFKILFSGRYYTFERVSLDALDEIYPLAFLAPKGVVRALK